MSVILNSKTKQTVGLLKKLDEKQQEQIYWIIQGLIISNGIPVNKLIKNNDKKIA